MMGLTHRQAELLKFLRAHFASHGCAPSNKKIAAHFNLSASAICYLLDGLEGRGRIIRRRKGSGFVPGIWLLPDPESHEPQCICSGCANTRYLAGLNLIHALRFAPDREVLNATPDNIAISVETRASLLGIKTGHSKAATRTRTALPTVTR